jgi:hypothetical protein
MREQIGLLFKDCKNSNRNDFTKFNNSILHPVCFCKKIQEKTVLNFAICYQIGNYLLPSPIRPPIGILFIIFIICFI